MYIRLDIRSKIILLIVANILMFKKLSTYEHLFIATIFSILILIFCSWYRAARIYAVYVILTIYEIFLAKNFPVPFLDNFLLFTSLLFKTIYFPICAGIILVGSSKVSELITFLRSIKMPKGIIIVLAVVFRFFPAMLTDYKLIKNSLKMKGIGVSNFYYFRHPFKFFEYVFVPYVIISTNIANELSISCLCRGIDNNNEATSIQRMKFSVVDTIFIFFVLLGTIAILMR